ncbi:DUF4190 domain-containing protein [Peterkaempfera bronchialis]|uniref:DUF4190 domain-containing protein n=1 Tax=Peterkaempfera bronchialis TaxID=2126346 RepID=UPI0013B3B061|nr:DUF4190 domain-containing protein [Peterkaempfera bronchialis]
MEGTNGFAIASLVLGLTCLAPVSAAFGIAALVQLRRRSQRGRGLAVTGLVLSAVWMVLAVVAAVGGLAYVASHPGLGGVHRNALGQVTERTEAYVDDLRVGDCFDRHSPTALHDLALLPCDEPHEAEAYGIVTYAGGAYPGSRKVQDFAEKRCAGLAADYNPDIWAYPDTLETRYYWPDRDQWEDDDPTAVCFFTDTRGSWTGTLRRSRTSFTDNQLRYLDAARIYNDVMDAQPDGEPGDRPSVYRAWAGEVADALEKEADLLDSDDWPTSARRPVAAFVRQNRAAVPYWRQAASAADGAALERALNRAFAQYGGEEARAARVALGLSTGDDTAGLAT